MTQIKQEKIKVKKDFINATCHFVAGYIITVEKGKTTINGNPSFICTIYSHTISDNHEAVARYNIKDVYNHYSNFSDIAELAYKKFKKNKEKEAK